MEFLQNDVNDFLHLEDFENDDKAFIAKVFKLLISIYRDKWNPRMQNLGHQINRMNESISKISSAETRDSLRKVLAEEHFVNKLVRKRGLLIDSKTNLCIFCKEKDGHDFSFHVKNFQPNDQSIRRLVKHYFQQHQGIKYTEKFIKFLFNFISVGINSLIDDSSFGPNMDKKGVLINVLDQLLTSFFEERNFKSSYLNPFINDIQKAIMPIADDSIQNTICNIVNLRLDACILPNSLFPITNVAVEQAQNNNINEKNIIDTTMEDSVNFDCTDHGCFCKMQSTISLADIYRLMPQDAPLIRLLRPNEFLAQSLLETHNQMNIELESDRRVHHFPHLRNKFQNADLGVCSNNFSDRTDNRAFKHENNEMKIHWDASLKVYNNSDEELCEYFQSHENTLMSEANNTYSHEESSKANSPIYSHEELYSPNDFEELTDDISLFYN